MSSWSAPGSRGSVPRTICSTNCPGRTYAILEGRPDIGGTWDLFRYPGVRSDSDMHTLGYSFKPWKAAKSIADGPSILEYLRETVAEFGIGPHIRFDHLVERAEWSTDDARVDRQRHPGRHRGIDRVHVQLPVHVLRLLQLQGRLHAGVPRHRELRRAGRPPAGLARRPRLRRQAGRRHRIRRHGRHAGAGDGRRGRARHDAPAITDLRGLATGRGCDRQHAAQGAPRRPRLRHHAAQEHHAAAGALQADAVAAREVEGATAQDGPQGARRRLRRRHPFHAARTTRGTSGCAWCPTATSSTRSRRAGRRSSPTSSTRSPRRASACSPATSSTPTSSSRPPACSW